MRERGIYHDRKMMGSEGKRLTAGGELGKGG
jgi:hypothetical protein